MTDEVEVLGVRFQRLTRKQAADEIARLSKDEGKGYVVKPYSEFMPRAARDERLMGILNAASVRVADGMGILWAAHYLSLSGGAIRALVQMPLSLLSMVVRPSVMRKALPEPMAGVDLTWEMLASLENAGASVFLLGGSRSEAEGARAVISARLPELRIVGTRHGHFNTNSNENEEVITEINAAAPDALLVAMGFPRQELWIARNLERLNVHAAVAEGGSFTFIAGAVPRAPQWMRRSGLEWLFRLLSQPGRLRRQLALPLFVWLVLRERLSSR
jgi:N-acetylglucosaminyldiphosphoundecaprenol N-acetyl-beta-D-mannosaminyltransferase